MNFLQKMAKYIYLFWFGGSFYVTIEVLYRQYSHWTMFFLAGSIFVIVDLLNEVWDWKTSLILQIITGTVIATVLEFVTGYIVNIYLKWNVWNYSNMKFNILGQICPQFIVLWIPLIILAIILGDVIRWKFFQEEKPVYKLF